MTAVEAVNAVMLAVMGIGKNQRNNTPGQSYQFRGIDAIINAVGPALRAHGVVVSPRVVSCKQEEVIVGAKRTAMRLTTVEMEYTWRAGGDSFVTSTIGEAFDSGDKGAAKAQSVAYRVALIQTLCIPTDEPDPDAETHERAPRVEITDEWWLDVQDAQDRGDVPKLKGLGATAKDAQDQRAIDRFREAWPICVATANANDPAVVS